MFTENWQVILFGFLNVNWALKKHLIIQSWAIQQAIRAQQESNKRGTSYIKSAKSDLLLLSHTSYTISTLHYFKAENWLSISTKKKMKKWSISIAYIIWKTYSCVDFLFLNFFSYISVVRFCLISKFNDADLKGKLWRVWTIAETGSEVLLHSCQVLFKGTTNTEWSLLVPTLVVSLLQYQHENCNLILGRKF